MRVILLGAGGMLGRDVAATAPRHVALCPFTRADLDITDTASLERVIAAERPDVIINAAAYTAVDRAETERAPAYRVNAEAVGDLGRIAAAAGCRIVHFSTDYVFDGTSREPYAEDAPPNPINVYGASKLGGEVELSRSGASALVVRTQWLFGVHGRSFPRTMLERARQRLPTTVVSDQHGRPTFTPDLAAAVWDLVDRGAAGVYHVANRGTATWWDVARQVFAHVGVPALVTPCGTSDYPVAARRPAHAVLALEKFEACTGRPLPPWPDALDRFLSACGAAPSPRTDDGEDR